MNNPTSVRNPGGILVACALAATLSVNAQAQTAPAPASADADNKPVVLEDVVVTATRTPNDPRTVGSTVEKISGDELARRQVTTVAEALSGPAGAPFTTGGTGGITSVFLRGSNSNQTLFLVDGVRLGDSNTAYRNFIGGAMPSPFESIEVVRGPQSTLYGADAVGGTISIGSQRGQGAPTETISAFGGSFDTYGGSVAAQGERGAWAYSAFVGAYHTDNERINNEFDTTTVALRVDRTLSDTLSLGSTVRGFRGKLESPDDITVNDPNNFDEEQNWLTTVFADVKPTDDLVARLTLGGQIRRLVSETPAPNPSLFSFPGTIDSERALLDGQATYTGVAANKITAGFNLEATEGQNSAQPKRTASQTGVFLQDEINPLKDVFVTGGVRYDYFNRFDDRVTGRTTVAWLPVPNTVKLRASYGTAYRTPAFTDLYGTFGNPDVRPEKARGGDVGADYYLPNKRGALSATYFQNRYTDLIEYPFPAFTPQNVGRARTEGVELSAKVALTDTLTTRASYTYTDAKNEITGARLLRRPRHAVDLDVWNDFGRGVSVGAGLHAVADYQDINAATFATIDGEDYTTVRVYAAWEVNERLTLKTRVENLFDEEYAPVNGFPALGLGVFGGVDWKF